MATNTVDWSAEVHGAVLAMKDEGQKAYAYLKQEAPEVANEYVRWQIVKGLSGAVPLAIASAIGFAIAVKSYQRFKRNEVEIADRFERGDWGFGAIMACAFACALLGGAMAAGSEAVKAIVAPRIVVIDGIGKVLK